MNSKLLKISEVKENPKNPRKINDTMFRQLVKSIKDFPNMLEMRPLVVDENNIVLGGNMRLKALKELGYEEIPVVRVIDLTEEQKEEFIVKDNMNYGVWDWEMLNDEWNTQLLNDWGLDIMEIDEDLDYSILDDDDEDLDEILDGMTENAKKSVCIEVPDKHYIDFRDKIRDKIENGVEVWKILNEII